MLIFLLFDGPQINPRLLQYFYSGHMSIDLIPKLRLNRIVMNL